MLPVEKEHYVILNLKSNLSSWFNLFIIFIKSVFYILIIYLTILKYL